MVLERRIVGTGGFLPTDLIDFSAGIVLQKRRSHGAP